jgi:hypothetical protein
MISKADFDKKLDISTLIPNETKSFDVRLPCSPCSFPLLMILLVFHHKNKKGGLEN